MAIAIYVKFEKPLKEKKVYYADVWGLRTEKYEYLRKNEVTSTDWQVLEPKEPYYFFVPKDFALQEEYEKFWKVTDIFEEGSSGVETGKDDKLVGFTPEEKIKVFQDILNPEITLNDLESRHDLKSTSGWKIEDRRKDLFRKGETFARSHIVQYAYRPFDTRYTYYCNFLPRTHTEIMKHLLKSNLALLCMREVVIDSGFSHIFVTNLISDRRMFLSNRGNPFVFPLYRYADGSKRTLFNETAINQEHNPNFSEKFFHALNEALGTEPTPEEIFYYIYAVLYSPTYRKRYEEFLKFDFPRVPLSTDYERFKELGVLGKELVDLHLLKHPSLSATGVGFPVSGTNTVEKVSYDEENGRVYFNKTQYFDGISKEVWEYRIGAYQVQNKYLKDRRKRELTREEIEHYMKVVAALRRTISVQEEIDGVLAGVFTS